MHASLLPGRHGAAPRVGAARAWSAVVFALAAVVICGSRLSFEGRGAVVLEQPDRLTRLTARLDLHKSMHHGSDSQMRQWHEGESPSMQPSFASVARASARLYSAPIAPPVALEALPKPCVDD